MKTAWLLIAHGSRRAEANADLLRVAEALRRRGQELVVASYLELAAPTILEGGEECVRLKADRVLLLPYFLSPGAHVRQDLTQAQSELQARHPQVLFLLAEPLGLHPLMIDVLEQRADEALRGSGS